MKKFTNKKGFTIMEMLIVVAIIAVLVAIAIPTFSSSLEKAKEAADVANIRAAYAEVQVTVLSDSNATIPTNEAGFVAYLNGATLNFNKTTTNSSLDSAKEDRLYYTYTSGTPNKATITYEAQALDGGKTYTWELEDIN